MSRTSTPLDDSVHLEEMDYFPDSDTAQIISPDREDGQEDGVNNSVSNTSASDSCKTTDEKGAPIIGKRKAYITVATLLFINLLNYMDRFTIAGVLKQVQDYYHIDNSEAGIIQTSFIIAYMIFSPIFGYLGDRYTRKYIMAIGILLWSGFTLGASFIGDKHFGIFVLMRALVGIGEASYSTIAPTIIADLFAKQMRTRMLMVFYFAIPVGSGLGFIVGANVAELFHDWKYALRVTPGLGLICVVLIILFCQEPVRGMSEGGTHLHATDILTDLKSLFKNKSFMLSSVGFTCVAFATGSLAIWAPTFMTDAIASNGGKRDDALVSLEFGVITVVAGFLGVFLGAEGARWYRRYNKQADPLICAFGLLSSVPFLFFALTLAKISPPATWFLIFVGETLLCLNWALTADILLYVVIPTRRSTAEAMQILLSHAFGDAGSPYLTGAVADALAPYFGGSSTSPSVQFVTLQYALYMTAFVCVLGGGAYLATAIYIEGDKQAAKQQTQEMVERIGTQEVRDYSYSSPI
ncbi:protein spinster homolog 1-like isoform X2 [Pomacea canaliculata]|uniref:protein spinster homolog 1-like isoform X2 n=1 Tax=Pomacea canaliculata TaxID=400727 RepID=UPI000D73F822|nr:protein spinster homolog 1-like isoform X2 [Pomacea canaliculata]